VVDATTSLWYQLALLFDIRKMLRKRDKLIIGQSNMDAILKKVPYSVMIMYSVSIGLYVLSFSSVFIIVQLICFDVIFRLLLVYERKKKKLSESTPSTISRRCVSYQLPLLLASLMSPP
jgi:hypothetical protein